MLSNYTLKGLWPEVMDIYKQHPELHDAKITRTQDTALHVAVSSGKEDKVKNERENTPLHLAAALGNVRMCKIIADVDNGLIGVRNKENETPFFLGGAQW
ncbi:hypothetical protein Acr_17g0003300 [Actinidia rufa]|uniref:Ankyrin repeat family protein n=1 Tax=Actinidia rufa TaxID=165716 RepID=A0A7J0G1W3_9ERIC|nr:hypothetical protein Acr_17g0003300 [Actinidia rufa]